MHLRVCRAGTALLSYLCPHLQGKSQPEQDACGMCGRIQVPKNVLVENSSHNRATEKVKKGHCSSLRLQSLTVVYGVFWNELTSFFSFEVVGLRTRSGFHVQ